MTPGEMARLCQELSTTEFEAAHPVLQSSYAHYAFVLIHPFADGNGRVARALASVFTYRAVNVPVLILVENRRTYLNTLSSADKGDYQPFIDFIQQRTFDALQWVGESIRAAQVPSAEEALREIEKLYMTTGGLRHKEVDSAGANVLGLLAEILENALNTVAEEAEQINAGVGTSAYRPQELPDGYRGDVTGKVSRVVAKLNSAEPVATAVSRSFEILLPRDAGKSDDILVTDEWSDRHVAVRIEQVLPNPSDASRLRFEMLAEGLAKEMLTRLAVEAEITAQKKGF